jgi:hypothetical protein
MARNKGDTDYTKSEKQLLISLINDYFLYKRKFFKAKHVKQWFYLLVDKYNIENCYLKLTAPITKKIIYIDI